MTDLDLMTTGQLWFMAGASVVAWAWVAVLFTRTTRPRRYRETYTAPPRHIRVNIARGKR